MKKNIVITGASQGIGKATTLLAASKGYTVFAISRNIDELKGITNIIPFSVDLSQHEAITTFCKSFLKEVKNIDILINNAGLLANKSFQLSNFDIFEEVFKVNVFGLAELTRQLIHIINSKGHVVNISSMGGIQGSLKFPGLAAYSSSKGAVTILTELLAEEYKELGPCFNALALGSVQTEMLEKAFPGYEAAFSTDEMAHYILKFALTGHHFYNGKILPVSLSTP